MSIDKFPHLQDIDPTPENIKKFLVEKGAIDDKHLWQLWVHFKWIREKSSNPEVILAADNILVKIDNIMNLWQKEFALKNEAMFADDYDDRMVA